MDSERIAVGPVALFLLVICSVCWTGCAATREPGPFSTTSALQTTGGPRGVMASSRAFGTGTSLPLAVPKKEEHEEFTGAVSPHYIIGPGDRLIINLWGKRTETYNPEVDENGFVRFQVEGSNLRFPVNGLYFKDLKKRVVRELAKLTADIDPEKPESSGILVDVSLGAIRGINVMVFGEVNDPGQQRIKATVSSVFNVIEKAGGLTSNGSLREIMVRRPGGKVDEIDLARFDFYAFKETGEIDEKLFHLHDGDMVIVPSRKRVVTMGGDVKKTGEYEIKEGDTLGAVVEAAGGLSAGADTQSIRVCRLRNGDPKPVTIDYGKEADFKLVDGDQIWISKQKELVEIRGAVRFPRTVRYERGASLAHYISLAGGMTDQADKGGALVIYPDGEARKAFGRVFSAKVLPGTTIEIPEMGREAEDSSPSVPGSGLMGN